MTRGRNWYICEKKKENRKRYRAICTPAEVFKRVDFFAFRFLLNHVDFDVLTCKHVPFFREVDF